MADKNQISDSKNAVTGNITDANVRIGDDTTINNNYYGNENHQIPKELTARIPKLRVDQIVGRRKDLKDLKDRLFANKQVVVVNGMGGIGKTTLAQVYLSENLENYQHVAWIPMLSGKLADDLIQADGILRAFNIATQNKLPADLFREVLAALKNIKTKPNLLVLDNADHQLAKDFQLLPNQPNWHILVTSRQEIENFDVKNLDFLDEADAIHLFEKHYNRSSLDQDFLKKLVASVDYHTLTIEILAKTANRHRTKPEKLLKAFQEDLFADIKVRHSDSKVERVTSYLQSIFEISKLNENEHWLLQNMICLPLEFHAFDLLEKLIQPKISEREAIFSSLLDDLKQKGWILYNEKEDAYKIHRVIGEVIGRSLEMAEEIVEGLIDSVTGLLFFDGAKDNPVDKFQWISFGEAVLEYFGESKKEQIGTLQNNLGYIFKLLGNYKKSKKLLQKAMKSDEENFGEKHPTTAIRYSNLGLVLRDLGDYEGAKILLQKTLKSDEENFGEKHPNTARTSSNLATVLQGLGDHEGAKILLQKALKSAEEKFGEKHPTTAVRYSNLAIVLQGLGDYEGAKVLLQKALKSAEEKFGEKHPTTAVSYSNLAMVLHDLGDYEGAKVLLQKALKSDEENFGEKHPNTAIRYSNLALVLQDLGDFEGAKILFQKALKICEESFGKSHPSTAHKYWCLASVSQSLKNYEEAKVYFEKVIPVFEEKLGIEHPRTKNLISQYDYLLKLMQEKE